jgi:hypothetical protein
MKPRSLLLASLFGSLLAGLSISATAAANPYLAPIVKRNVFSLGQILSPRPVQPSPPSVTLRGIARLPAGSHALLRLPRVANSTAEQSLWLREGVTTEGEVQVIQIDVSAASVRVVMHGQIRTLKLEGD